MQANSSGVSSVYVRSDEYRPRERRLLFGPHVVVSTDVGAPDLVAEIRNGVMWEARSLSVLNGTSVDATLWLYAVPPGGTISFATAELVWFTVPANTAVSVTDIVSGFYLGGTQFYAYADTSSSLQIRGQMIEYGE